MRIEQARRITFQTPQGPLGRLLGLLVLFLVVVAALFVFVFGAVVAGLGLLLAPVIGWWRSRKAIHPPSRPAEIAEEPPPVVIDAEFSPVPDPSADEAPTE